MLLENNLITLFLIPLVVAIVAMIIEYWIVKPLLDRHEDQGFSQPKTTRRFAWPKISPRFLLILGILFLSWYGIRWVFQDDRPTLEIGSTGELTEIIDGTPHIVSPNDPRIVGYVSPPGPGDITRFPRLDIGSEKLGTLAQNRSNTFRLLPDQEQIIFLKLEYITGECFELALFDSNGHELIKALPSAYHDELRLRFAAEVGRTYLIKVENCSQQGGSYSLQINTEP
jgi:hypothetical protein